MKFDFFRPREKFLILTVGHQGTSGWFLNVDEDRTITFEKHVENIDLETYFEFLKSPTRHLSQKRWEGEQLFKSRRKVIAAADPSVATTIPIPLELVRDAGLPKAKITLPELENLIAQAMAKIFNGCRTEAAQRLHIHELDAVLVGAKALHFMIDGQAFASPAGRTGKKISLLLELTFTSRKVFEDLKQFFNSPDHFFFAESPQVELASLARVRPLPLNLVREEANGAALYVLQAAKDDYPVLYREKFEWKPSALFEGIIKELGVSEAAARELYRAFLQGEMSEVSARAFKKSIQPAVEALFMETDRAGVKGFMYVDAKEELPIVLPHRRGILTIEKNPVMEVLDHLGFHVDIESAGSSTRDRNSALRSTLYLLEAYFDRTNSEINQKLRRRLHWLTD